MVNSTELDPRWDPQLGDVVKQIDPVMLIIDERTVEELLPNGLRWSDGPHRHGTCMLRTWRRWAKGAEVIHAE